MKGRAAEVRAQEGGRRGECPGLREEGGVPRAQGGGGSAQGSVRRDECPGLSEEVEQRCNEFDKACGMTRSSWVWHVYIRLC